MDRLKSQEYLAHAIIKNDLCTSCGACVNICPYFESSQDRIAVLHSCEGTDGACFEICPRTPINLSRLHKGFFGEEDYSAELGTVKGFYITRAADPEVRMKAQHGGTVTTLLSLALKEGIIDVAVVTGESDPLLPRAVGVQDESKLMATAKSLFVASSNIACFNKIARSEARRIGIVATPCQAIALAKMRLSASQRIQDNISKLELVIGLFCGWAFSWAALKNKLKGLIEEGAIIGMDIPPSSYRALELCTDKGKVSLPLEDFQECIRPSCQYCCDMTTEFSDISVGSARLPEGWEEARTWNQVIVRTPLGERLIEVARSKGFLEFRPVPEGNFEKLKSASLRKKKMGIHNLRKKSTDPQHLVYLDPDEKVVRLIQEM